MFSQWGYFLAGYHLQNLDDTVPQKHTFFEM